MKSSMPAVRLKISPPSCAYAVCAIFRCRYLAASPAMSRFRSVRWMRMPCSRGSNPLTSPPSRRFERPPCPRHARTSSNREGALSPLHRDPFEFGHFFHRKATTLTTVTAVLDAAEWHVRLVPDRAVVEMDHPGIQPEREIKRLLHIIGNHARRKSVVGGVGYLKRLLVIADLDD